jgi:hypothetical protein
LFFIDKLILTKLWKNFAGCLPMTKSRLSLQLTDCSVIKVLGSVKQSQQMTSNYTCPLAGQVNKKINFKRMPLLF